MSIRDDLLPVVDQLRQLPDDFGLRRYTVTIRRRVWSGGAPGLGTPANTDLVLTPKPKVRQLSSREVADSGGTYEMGDYELSRITPRYSSPTTGGYTPTQLLLQPEGADQDVCVILNGDEGEIECQVVTSTFDRAFRYTLVVRRRVTNVG